MEQELCECGGLLDQPEDPYYGGWCTRCTMLELGVDTDTNEREIALWESLPNAVEVGLPDEEATNVLVVTVKIWPKGNPEFEYTLGTAYIRNDGTGSPSKGNYTYDIVGRGESTLNGGAGRIEGFPRKRLIAWELVHRVLDQFHSMRK